jgi:hypothetical protein
MMNPSYVPVGRPLPRPGVARAPLRRALPAGHRPQRRVPTSWLLFCGAVVLLDIELGLAYLLHFAAGLLD